ncbi:MAG: endonuclease/exonuclease/phosphatase family protein [Muribaculaceae bacterium]|nr:endonuclease/exonuclease/phosphatase family protein [Muribaculaceae bacterium]MDE6610240.1 endonuclease/exonuclease/phosphatase family protein [Muribaculaceae bacterium]
MKKTIFIAAAAIAALASCSEPTTVKMMSYNIHNGIGLDEVTDYARIGEMIKSHNPDVVAIQEIDSATTRSEGVYVLGEIAKAAGMNDYYAPAIDYRGGKYGIGLLCKEEPISIKRHALPGREEQRAIIIAEFPEYAFACTHLSLTEDDRNASAEIIRSLAKEYDKPFYIAGDFNAKPESQFIKDLTTDFTPLTETTAPTFPADTPNVVIDYVMSYNPNGVSVIAENPGVIDEPAMSDHRPIIVTVSIPE